MGNLFQGKDKTPIEDPDGAAIRVDEAVRTIQEPVRVALKRADRANRRLGLVIGVVIFDIILSLGLGFGLYRANVATEQSKAAVKAACVAGNEFRKGDLETWNFILALSNPTPPNQTPAQKAQADANLQAFKQFLAVKDAPRVC